MKKKLISLLLAAMLVLSLLPMAALAVEDPEDVVPAQAGYIDGDEAALETEEETPAADAEEASADDAEEEAPAVLLTAANTTVVEAEDEEAASEEEAEPVALAEDEDGEPVADGSGETITVTVAGETEKGVYDIQDSAEVGYWFEARVNSGYAIEVTCTLTDGTKSVPDELEGPYVYVDDEGIVSYEYDIYIDGDIASLTVNVVASVENVAEAIEVIVTGEKEAVVTVPTYCVGGSEFFLDVMKGYAVSISGGKISDSWSDDGNNCYYILPSTDATEVTVTVTKKDAGTLSITGATDKVTVAKDGDTIQNGAALDWADILTITVAQGYLLTGQNGFYDADTGSTVYTVYADDLEQDGKAVVDIQQGVIVKFAGAVDAGLSWWYSFEDGETVVVGSRVYFDTASGYVADLSGVEMDYTTYYECTSDTGEVYAEYYVTVKSAGTLTATLREAKTGELPTAIQIEYVDAYDALDQSSSYKYVMPGGYLYVRMDSGYTAQVEGATFTGGYNNNEWAAWNGVADEDATAVKVTVVPLAENAVLQVSGESSALASGDMELFIGWGGFTSSYNAAGDILEDGTAVICLKNGYTVSGVDGGQYSLDSYYWDENGDIYAVYNILATADPVTVTVSKTDPVKWVDVSITGETEQITSFYAWSGEELDDSMTAFRIMSAENPSSFLMVDVKPGYTVKVTGGTVESYINNTGSLYYIYPDNGVTSITVEIIAGNEAVIVPTTSSTGDTGNTGNNNSSDNNNDNNNNSDNSNNNSNSNNSSGSNNSGNSSGSNGSAPKTGDETNIALWAVLALGCGAGLAAVLTARKRREN